MTRVGSQRHSKKKKTLYLCDSESDSGFPEGLSLERMTHGVLLDKLRDNKFSAICGVEGFVAVFTGTRLFSARSLHSTPLHRVVLRRLLIISSHLRRAPPTFIFFNPLNAELNPICYLLALLAHHFLHVSRIRVKSLTLKLLMSYIYGAPILDVSRSHTTTQHSR